MALEIFGSIVAGLGIFFIAFRSFSFAIQEVASHKIRDALQKFTKTISSSSAVGLIMGFLIQDMAIVVCILGSLTSLGFLTLHKIIFIVLASNIGGIFILYFVFLDIKLIIIYMLGITGILLYLQKPFYLRYLYEILFYFFLMQYGILLINAQAIPVSEFPFIQTLLQVLEGANPLYIFFGTALCVILFQSIIPLLIISLSFFTHHLISFEFLMLVIYGLHLGTSFRYFMIAMISEPFYKKIFLIQIIFSSFTAFFFLFLYYVELYFGTHYIKDFITSISVTPAIILINLIMLAETTTAVILALGSNKIISLLTWMYPDTKDRSVSMMTYLGKELLVDTESAIQGLEKEINLIASVIVMHVDNKMSQQSPYETDPVIVTTHDNFLKLKNKIAEFITEVLTHHFQITAAPAFFETIERINLMISLENTVFLLCSITPPPKCSEKVLKLFHKTFESAHSMLFILLNYTETYHEDDLEVLTKISSMDRSVYKDIQMNLYDESGSVTEEEKAFVFSYLRFMEQISWTINKFIAASSQKKT